MDHLLSAAAAIVPRQQSTGETTINCKSGDTACEFLSLISSPFSSALLSDAFLASLVTYSVLTVVIAGLFCLVRPYNNAVYAPRAKYADSKHAPPPAGKGLLGWIPPLIRTTEQDMVQEVGLDAAVFMRFVRMCRNIFAILSVIGCGVLIPVNILAANDAASGTSFFMRFTPQYMYGSKAFWAHVVVAYVFDGVIFFFLWFNYRAVVRLRRQYFDSTEYQRSLHSRTLLLTDIPKELRSDDGIVRITEDIKAGTTVGRAAIARNVKDLPELVEEHEQAVRQLEKVLAKYLKDPNKLPPKRPTCKVSKNDKSYTKGQTVDAIEYLTARIKELELEIKEVRESVDKRNAMPYGFASYGTIPEAHTTAYVARKQGPQGTIIRLAPKPNDLVWKNLRLSKSERNWQNIYNNFWVALLTVLWIVPNVLIAVFLSNLTHLGALWPAFNKSLMAHRNWWALVQGVAAPAITTIFYIYLPAIFRKLCIKAGDVTKTSRERHVMHKLYSFFVFNNLVVFSLFSAVFAFFVAVSQAKTGTLWEKLENQHPFNLVILTLCQTSPYWVYWLLQRNLGAAVDLSQLVSLVWGSFSRRFLSPTPRELIELTAPQPFLYAGYYNYFLFYATVAVCFAALQPLVLPVTAFYFWMDSFMKKYLLLYVFITKYESGGLMWPAVFNRMLVLTFLGNGVIALLVGTQGDIGANWAMLAAMAPLPFLIIGFKWYCARTFDDQIYYYQKGKAMRDSEIIAGSDHKKSKGDRVGVRFGHPVLYKPLMTPMVAAKSQHLLKQVYSGRTSMDGNHNATGYGDVYMDSMDANHPGKSNGTSAPFEIVHEGQMDFEHWKNRPEFRDEAGGDGALYGHAQDIVRPGTPGTMTTMTRTGTMQTFESRSRSESREAHSRHRSDSRDSDSTKVAGETEYPRGYHQTPNALREHSPAGSDFGGPPGRFTTLERMDSRERLVAGASRMGRSPPPGLPEPYHAQDHVGYTPGSTTGEEDTSYDYFRRGRNL